jgi:hypothetical protein
MEYPIDSPRWHQTSTHPSSVEIFKIVSDQARGKIAPPLAASVAVSQPSATNHEFQLVRVDGLNSGRDLPDWLTPADWRAAVLSAEPFRSFAVLFGLAQLSTLLGKPIVPEGTAASISLSAQSTQPSSASAVARNVPAVPGLQISVRADSVLLLCMGVSVIVRY